MTKYKQTKTNSVYDLEERTLEFAKRIIRLCKSLPKNIVNNRLIDQLMRAGNSPGANYREANEAETKREFKYKICTCRKEAKETSYWLELIIEANNEYEERIKSLLQESIELRKIFSSIAEKVSPRRQKV